MIRRKTDNLTTISQKNLDGHMQARVFNRRKWSNASDAAKLSCAVAAAEAALESSTLKPGDVRIQRLSKTYHGQWLNKPLRQEQFSMDGSGGPVSSPIWWWRPYPTGLTASEYKRFRKTYSKPLPSMRSTSSTAESRISSNRWLPTRCSKRDTHSPVGKRYYQGAPIGDPPSIPESAITPGLVPISFPSIS